MNIKGIIREVMPIQSIQTKKGTLLRKREALVETEERYPQSLLFELIDDDVDNACLLPGMKVEIEVNFRAVKYKDKYYNNFRAWKITRINDEV